MPTLFIFDTLPTLMLAPLRDLFLPTYPQKVVLFTSHSHSHSHTHTHTLTHTHTHTHKHTHAHTDTDTRTHKIAQVTSLVGQPLDEELANAVGILTTSLAETPARLTPYGLSM